MSYLKLVIAMPTEGEGIEALDADKFADNIAKNVKAVMDDDVNVTVEVFPHDGTGESFLRRSKDVDVTMDDFVDEIANAFCDPTSYSDN